jgi:L-iditol 2-dehydrogenase
MSEKMKIAAFTDVGKVEIKEVEKPIPRKGEVLVKVKACAICTWEQRIFKGISSVPFPFVGGHEISGVIEELGEGVDTKRWHVGMKVAPRVLYSCNECYYCRLGEHNLCEDIGKGKEDYGLPLPGPGGLSEYLTIKTTSLFKLSQEVPFEYGALSEPLACVIHSIERAKIEIGNDVVIIGAGIMGLMHLQLAKKKGAYVIVSEPNENRRVLAKRLGADEVIDASKEDPIEKVKGITEGRGADVVIDTVIFSSVAQQAVQMVGKMGRVIFYSSIHPDNPITVSPNMIHNTEITLTGSVSPNITDFLKSTTLLSKGMIEVSPLISDVIPFNMIQKAFEESIKPENYRIVVKFD